MNVKDQLELLKGQYARHEINFASYYLELSILRQRLEKERRAARSLVKAAMSEAVVS